MTIILASEQEFYNIFNFNGCTLKYGNIELLNGYNPSNVVHIKSGGSANDFTSTTRKTGIRYVSPTTKNIIKIYVQGCCDYQGTSNESIIWRCGIQADNGFDEPSGNFLASGTHTILSDDFTPFTLNNPVSLIKGSKYWIVVQYESGPAPISPTPGIYNSAATLPYSTPNGEVPLPFNYGGIDTNIESNSYVITKHWNGSSWSQNTYGRNMPCFGLKFSDGTYHGQAYRHNYMYLGNSSNMIGQLFTNVLVDKTIDNLEVPCNSSGTTPPSDNLYYYIHEGSWNGPLLSSGIFLTPSELYIGSGGPGDRRWYSKALPTPITLRKDTQYFIYLNSPGSGSPFWQSDSGIAYNFDSLTSRWLEDTQELALAVSWDSNRSRQVRVSSGTSWSAVRDIYPNQDMNFRCHLVDNFNGTITSINLDSEIYGSIGDIWTGIKLSGALQSGTSIDIEGYSTQCGNYINIQNNAVFDTVYTFPTCLQQRTNSIRLNLHTTTAQFTPKINVITLFTNNNTCPQIISSITITQV